MWTIEEEKVRLRRVALAREKWRLVGVLRELERRRDEAVELIAEVDGRIAELEEIMEALEGALEAEEIMGECECECVYNGKVL